MPNETYVFDDFTLDVTERRLVRGATVVALEPKTFDVLTAFARQPGRVFTRGQLIERIWGWDFYGDERLVDVHIRNLRKAIGDAADEPRFVGTVRGVGYKCVAHPS